MDKMELVALAEETQKNAYAPYSNFSVGAALLCRNDRVFTGCNVENSSYGLTVCAERNAVSSAVAAGEREFSMLAITADTEKPIIPCGACLQVLAEFNSELLVVSAGTNGSVMEKKVEDLLPLRFHL